MGNFYLIKIKEINHTDYWCLPNEIVLLVYIMYFLFPFAHSSFKIYVYIHDNLIRLIFWF